MSNNFVDIKKTIWKRYYLNNDISIEKVRKTLEEDISNFELSSDMFNNSEILENTEIYMDPFENNNEPTVEIYKDSEKIWDNTEICE